MFTTQLNTLVIIAAGLSASAAPASVKHSDTSPALVAREPQLNATLPNQLPVQGVLPFDITLTPGAQNTTVGLPSGFSFKSERRLEARQLNTSLPNQLPVEGVLPFDITLTPGAQNTTVGLPSGFPFKFKRDLHGSSTNDVDSDEGVFNFTRGSHFPFFFPIGRLPDNDNSTDSSNDTVGWWWGDEGSEGGAEKRQFNFTLPKRLPVEGGLPFEVNVTGGEQNSTVGVPSGFPF